MITNSLSSPSEFVFIISTTHHYEEKTNYKALTNKVPDFK